MAKDDAAKNAKGSSPKKGGKFKFMALVILSCIAMPFMFGSVLLLFVGLIPTYVAYFCDDDPEKQTAASVGVMNFAGVVPFLIELWGKGQAPSNAIQLLSEPNTWLVMMGASGVGYLIIYIVPQAIASISQGQAEVRIKTLKKNLELLKESWGADVASVKSAEKNR